VAENTSKGKAAKVPEGHRRVKWLFNPKDRALVGTVVDMPTAEAQIRAGENRIAYVPDGTPLGKAEPDGEPVPAPLAAGADTSGGRDTGSATANPTK
jgi:hypothetical protein